MELTTENTAVVLDSVSDYPEAPARFPNMRVVPLYVRFGDETYRDYVDITSEEFYEKLQLSPVTPTTSQPTPQDFVAAYEELDALVDRFRRDNRVVFTVETLDYLQRGGRIGKAQALAGSLLNVRPILGVQDGEVVAVARVRGRQKALAEFERRFTDATADGPGLHVAIAHANAPEWVGTISELVWRVRPKAEIEFTAALGAVVGTHAGPGAVGFFWFQDD